MTSSAPPVFNTSRTVRQKSSISASFVSGAAGRPLNRPNETKMRATTAEIAGERLLDLRNGRILGLREEGSRLDNHAVETVAALCCLLVE